jgi:small conductance mechanosensitive channel
MEFDQLRNSLWDEKWGSLADLAKARGSSVVSALILMLTAWLVADWMSRFVNRGMRRARIDETLTKFSSKLSRWVVLGAGLWSCLETFGVKTTSFAALFGAAGLAFGLAFQGTLSNFAAGVMLLIFRPYRVGDQITVGGQSGKVDEIDLFSTTLDTGDHRRIFVPNGSIFGSTIENTTFHRVRRVDISIGVAYSADIDATYDVLVQAVSSVPGRLEEPVPEIILDDLADCAVKWKVRIWCRTDEFALVKQRLLRAVKLSLDEARIEIPFPQLDVNIRKSPQSQSLGRVA